MSDILELWSEPWHALQRSLAAHAAYDPVGIHPLGSAPRSLSAVDATWLKRARVRAQSAASLPTSL